MFRKMVATAAVAVALLAIGSTAQAVPIIGGINFVGFLTLDTDNVTSANAITGFAPPLSAPFPSSAVGGTGEFTGVAAIVTFTPVVFDPFGGPIANFYTFTHGLNAYSFNLTSLAIDNQGLTQLGLHGEGFLLRNGLDATPASFDITTQSPSFTFNDEALFTFSASSEAGAVPEPGTLLLLGGGLTGLAMRRRRRA